MVVLGRAPAVDWSADTHAVLHPQIAQIGYHCRDYYVKQGNRFKDLPWGDLAHSTHLRGAGTYDPETGVEQGRVTVTLATGIPEEQVREANLDYLDPAVHMRPHPKMLSNPTRTGWSIDLAYHLPKLAYQRRQH